jgi:hypothetical protein
MVPFDAAIAVRRGGTEDRIPALSQCGFDLERTA